jgi:glycosyltransferase involved in cell wall biosynthesis
MGKRVILITHEYPPFKGGAGIYCEEIAYAANKIGVDVEVWAPRNSIQNKEFKIKTLPWRGSHGIYSSLRLFISVLKFCNYNKNICIHVAELGSLRSFIRFGYFIKNLPTLILTIHGSELLKFTRNPIEKLLFRKLLSRTERIHVLSAFNEEKLISLFPELEKKILRFGGAPARRLLPTKNYTPSQRAFSKIGILCVGRIHPRKGQDQILLALKNLPFEIQKRVEITFVGSCTKKRYLNLLTKLSKDLAGKAIFAGERNEIELKTYFKRADIFTLTSMGRKNSVEGFGFVYLEASSYGLPIIANRTGGVEDAVIDQKTGLLAKPGNITELSALIEKLVLDKNLRERLAKEGQKWAKKHTWEKVAKAVYTFS